jgi:CheY-like chemotaxis protein
MQHVIALVDDDEFNLRLMDLWLRVAGYQTLRCAAQAAAYDLVRVARPAAIILDLMEGTRPAGWATLAHLQGDPLTRAIPVILCSAHTDLLRAQQGYLRSLGGDTLGKPFTAEELVAKLEAVLGPTGDHAPAEAA